MQYQYYYLLKKSFPQTIVGNVYYGVMELDILEGLELHKALKQMRLSRKLTQAKVAATVGVSTFTLIRWERGERAPDGIFLQKLAKTLGYSLIVGMDGLWTCYPNDDETLPLDTSFKPESIDDIYRKAVEAKDRAVWQMFFRRLVENNAELEAWFRKSDGGKEIDRKTFKILSDVVLTLVRSDE
jgi:transcriptional regulator with XRE-family HTH domain